MGLTPATSTQIPDHAILDFYNKQIYLGNQFIATTNVFSLPTANVETSLLYLSNSAANTKALFCNLRTVAATNFTNADSAVFKFYASPTLSSANKAVIPVQLRSGSATTSLATVALNPAVAPGTLQVSTVTTVADVSGSLNSKHFNLSSINAVTNAVTFWYVWFNINSAGVDPKIQGRAGIEVSAATNASATTLASDIKTALNALTSDFTATSSGATLVITLVIDGPTSFAVDGGGGGATGFTFADTTLGVSNWGTLISALPASGTLNDSLLYIVDPGESLLCSAFSATALAPIVAELVWYEL